MRIVIAPDKLKHSLTAPQAAEAIAVGLRLADPAAQLDICPLADGGEGTVDAMVKANGGNLVKERVTGPLPEMKVEAAVGLFGEGEDLTAVIEMSAASGLDLLRPEDRNPLNTTTFGTGELLLHAARLGARKIILGIGGSATCDGGIGCAQGAGLTVLLEGGEMVSMTEPLCGRDLDRVILVKRGRGSPVDHVQITVACDVGNPLFGPDGAAPVFAPQKGASAPEVKQLDDALRGLAQRTGKMGEALMAGAGAAGGLGFGMLSFFNAQLRPGIDLVMDAVGLRQRLKGADLCITAEGKLDSSSLQGKTPVGVARLCREMGVPCIVLAGEVPSDANFGQEEGIAASFSLVPGPVSLQEAQPKAADYLTRTAANLLRAIQSILPAQ